MLVPTEHRGIQRYKDSLAYALGRGAERFGAAGQFEFGRQADAREFLNCLMGTYPKIADAFRRVQQFDRKCKT